MKDKTRTKEEAGFFLFVILSVFLLLGFASAAPDGPDSVTFNSNETKGSTAAYTINISGGYISDVNITATSQNTKWKGMVGQVTGSFTLDDATGATLFDWSITNIAGEVYATRNSSSLVWTSINCANLSSIEIENYQLNHTGIDDNITATFSAPGATHSQFNVGTVTIGSNSCYTLNTYVGNSSQDNSFEEVILMDNSSGLVYSTIIEQNAIGYDNQTYDFQMIVPDNGLDTFTSSTAYYLYVELS